MEEKHTIEELFNDYDGEEYKTEIVNPSEAIGDERW